MRYTERSIFFPPNKYMYKKSHLEASVSTFLVLQLLVKISRKKKSAFIFLFLSIGMLSKHREDNHISEDATSKFSQDHFTIVLK